MLPCVIQKQGIVDLLTRYSRKDILASILLIGRGEVKQGGDGSQVQSGLLGRGRGEAVVRRALCHGNALAALFVASTLAVCPIAPSERLSFTYIVAAHAVRAVAADRRLLARADTLVHVAAIVT